MRVRRYIFDPIEKIFKKPVKTISGLFVTFVKYLLAASALAVVWYLLFALVVNTDAEKRLKAENRMYEAGYQELKENLKLLRSVVDGLEMRDEMISSGIFRNSAPALSAAGENLPEEDLSDLNVAAFTDERVERTLKAAGKVDRNFRKIFGTVLRDGCAMPPATAPVGDFSPTRAGASVGMRMSPFLKMEVSHDGLDIIVPSGSPVTATADGVVEDVTRSVKGSGNSVTIRHEGGYVTRYANMGSIAVARGSSVRRGTIVGTIGMSGLSYAPHLHYEVRKDGRVCDPVNYMFISVTPAEYYSLVLAAGSTGKSLD